MYILLDANVTAAYYLPRCHRSKRVRDRIRTLFDSVRSGGTKHFFYLPNFCVAEVFSVFMKYSFGTWNQHVRADGTLDKRVYRSLVKQFEKDIHNGRFIYHYELSRYHVLAMNLVAPVDHYFQISRAKRTGKRKAIASPMGTFDHLIIAMGIHLAHIHGADRVAVVSADRRLTQVLRKCRGGLPIATMRKLQLDRAETLTGRAFTPSSFPMAVNLATDTKADLADVFGGWPLAQGSLACNAYRWERLT